MQNFENLKYPDFMAAFKLRSLFEFTDFVRLILIIANNH